MLSQGANNWARPVRRLASELLGRFQAFLSGTQFMFGEPTIQCLNSLPHSGINFDVGAIYGMGTSDETPR